MPATPLIRTPLPPPTLCESNPLPLITPLREQDNEGETPVAFLTGCAGSGKSYSFIQKIKEDPSFAILASTTGISAINLGSSTINSIFGYFDTESLEDNYASGALARKIRRLRDFQWIVIDEVSMMHRKQLDLIVSAMDGVNETLYERGDPPIGLIITGDLAQLSPIPGFETRDGKKIPVLNKDGSQRKYNGFLAFKKEPTPWVFLADEWPRFDAHTIKLTKIWRQDNPQFLSALNAIRKGAGAAGVGQLQPLVNWSTKLDRSFLGTTLVSKNEEADNYNNLKLMDLPGSKISLPSSRWHASERLGHSAPGEWKNIPPQLALKEGTLVMILDNKKDPLDENELIYCNGDLGIIEDFSTQQSFDPNIDDGVDIKAGEGAITAVNVRLLRSGRIVSIGAITRLITQKHEPEEDEISSHPRVHEAITKTGQRVWVTGAITFFPLRLGWASTIHRSQGLTLNAVQICPDSHFFGSPGMVYTSLSRCRTPEGIRIVGRPQTLAERVKIDPDLRRFL